MAESIDLANQLRAKRLTADELFVLHNSPYDSIGKVWDLTPAVRQLIKDRLLEENPTAPKHYRITDRGERVLRVASVMARKLR